MPVTRPKELGDERALADLRLYANRKADAEMSLREAVRHARDCGASIRVIAEHSRLSTDTVQKWLKQD